jgi:hypothetical protein
VQKIAATFRGRSFIMRTSLHHSGLLLLLIAAMPALLPLPPAHAETNAGKKVDPNPYPKPALASDDVSHADYITVLLSPPLQAALKATGHQSAVFQAMRTRFDFNFNNIMSMRGTPSMNISRMNYVMDLTGKQIRDQLTVEQDKQLQEYFTKKILSRVSVESKTSKTPVYDPHVVVIPGLGHRVVQGSILHSGSITIHYTKFSEAGAATQPQTATTAPAANTAPATEVIGQSDLPDLIPDAEKQMDELRRSVKERAARIHAEHAQATTQAVAAQQAELAGAQQALHDAQLEAARRHAQAVAAQQAATQTPATGGPSSQPAPSTEAPAPAPVVNATAVHTRSPLRRTTPTVPLRIPPVIPPDTAATPSTDKLADTLTVAVSRAVEAKSLQATRHVGGGFADQSAFDMPAKPGVLVGFEFGIGNFMNNPVIHSLTPVYLTAAGEVRGHFYGKKCDQNISVRARDGYAVGGIIVRGGGGLDAVSVQFMKRGAESLNPEDAYYSDVIGGKLNQFAQEHSANGVPVIGTAVKVGDKGALGLGLILAGPQPSE